MRAEVLTQFGLIEAERLEQDSRSIQSEAVTLEGKVIQYEVLS
ncbi:hypothetical protein [Staphylococcus schleiferi]|nr:hypothetical protein [Staphylococcus schleiferi]